VFFFFAPITALGFDDGDARREGVKEGLHC